MQDSLASDEGEMMAKVTEEGTEKSPAAEDQEKETRLSRRSFLTGLGAAGVAATAQPLMAAVPEVKRAMILRSRGRFR